jgi:S1-C subfamily serine protease
VGHIAAMHQTEFLSMAESTNPLLAFSEATASLVERAAPSVVAVLGGGRWASSGIHWRAGVVVTAEERLERDEDIAIVLPGGRQVSATLAGRDPSTDVAALRFQPDGLSAAQAADTVTWRAGQVVIAVGNHEGAPVAHLGTVSFSGGAWQSMRGGTIDNLVRLDLALAPATEGGALIDAEGRVLGMVVSGPRRRVLAIPKPTIDRAVDQLLAKGHAVRGYLGAGLQHVRLGAAAKSGASSGAPAEGNRGLLIISLDPEGPAARAGLLVGDIITAWNGKPVGRLREAVRLLGPDSVGTSVELQLLRGGVATNLTVVVGERPLT